MDYLIEFFEHTRQYLVFLLNELNSNGQPRHLRYMINLGASKKVFFLGNTNLMHKSVMKVYLFCLVNVI
jgi:hypothetical protein